MKKTVDNEYADALDILYQYYRAVAERFAEDVVENEGEFAEPFLGNAEAVLEKYVPLMRQLGEAHEYLRIVGETVFREKQIQLREDEYLCFGCRAVMQKDQAVCGKCGWSWRKKS